MTADLHDLSAFVAVVRGRGPGPWSGAVVRAGGFRDGARLSGGSASGLSEAGRRLAERLMPALGEVEAALDVVNAFRDRPPIPAGAAPGLGGLHQALTGRGPKGGGVISSGMKNLPERRRRMRP